MALWRRWQWRRPAVPSSGSAFLLRADAAPGWPLTAMVMTVSLAAQVGVAQGAACTQLWLRRLSPAPRCACSPLPHAQAHRRAASAGPPLQLQSCCWASVCDGGLARVSPLVRCCGSRRPPQRPASPTPLPVPCGPPWAVGEEALSPPLLHRRPSRTSRRPALRVSSPRTTPAPPPRQLPA